MKKRYFLTILIITLAYGSLIFWDKEGSEIFQRFLSKQGQVVTFDQLQYEEASYFGEQIEVFPEDVPRTEEEMGFGEESETLAIEETTEEEKPLSGGTVAQLLIQNQETTNDAFIEKTRISNSLSGNYQKKIDDYFKWLFPS